MFDGPVSGGKRPSGSVLHKNGIWLDSRKVGLLTVWWPVGRDKHHHRMWLCCCECGRLCIVDQPSLRKGNHTTNCGCVRKAGLAKRNVLDSPNLQHGFARRGQHAPEYRVWQNMVARCTDPKRKDFPRYGGRGIQVCERWQSFANFLSDVGTKPFAKATLERMDNDKGYSPDNCRWATFLEQAHNTRKKKSGLSSWDDAIRVADAKIAALEAQLAQAKAAREHFVSQQLSEAHYGSFLTAGAVPV